MKDAYRAVKINGTPIKKSIVSIMMYCLGKGFQSLSKRDPDLKNEISAWPEGFSIQLEVLSKGPYLALKVTNGRMRYLGLKQIDADLNVVFKNIDSALWVFTGLMGIAQAWCESRMSVRGHLSDGLRLIRMISLVEYYLFPTIMSKRILKRLPRMPLWRLWYGRLSAYLMGVTLGI